MGRNHEVITRQPLLDGDGNLREPGWSRSLVQQYARKQIKAPRLRIKEWDYYLVMGRDFGIVLTVSDDGYIGLQSVSLLSFGERPWQHTETVLNIFPLGKLRLPSDSSSGVTEFRNKRLQLRFAVEGKTRRLTCRFLDFWDKKPLECDIVLQQPEMDSLVIATPFDKPRHFYYNQKINCMRASGWVRYDGREYRFDPATDFGTLDWGRGVWTYDNTWHWGSGNADIDGNAFGFNLGYGFGNTAAATENVVFWNSKAHKLDDVEFHIPANYTDPWKITSSDGRFTADFVPILDRAAKINFKFLVSDQHQVFGRMTGTAVLDDGRTVSFRELLCFAEKVHNRY